MTNSGNQSCEQVPKNFKALRVSEDGGRYQAAVRTLSLTDLTPGDTIVRVQYSSLNYKDALAVTGAGKILRRLPLTPGIDAAGRVLSSSDPRLTSGQQVLITGCGIGENDDGGYSEILRVKASSVVPLPAGLSLRETMILGTAGFTAALALWRMERNGQTPGLGPILVTGASGGVGGFAVQIFAQAGYEVIAVSGKPEAAGLLKEFGAREVIPPDGLKLGSRPLESVRFGGAVDNVGGHLLSQILASVQLWGNVASVGLTESAELHATVMPFILRGVSLLGTSSSNASWDTRLHLWKQLAGPWKPRFLEKMVARTVGLEGIESASRDLIGRRVRGRVLVQL